MSDEEADTRAQEKAEARAAQTRQSANVKRFNRLLDEWLQDSNNQSKLTEDFYAQVQGVCVPLPFIKKDSPTPTPPPPNDDNPGGPLCKCCEGKKLKVQQNPLRGVCLSSVCVHKRFYHFCARCEDTFRTPSCELDFTIQGLQAIRERRAKTIGGGGRTKIRHAVKVEVKPEPEESDKPRVGAASPATVTEAITDPPLKDLARWAIESKTTCLVITSQEHK